MTEARIAPRIDDDGVPWCDAGCPQADFDDVCGEASCEIDNVYRDADKSEAAWSTGICPHAVHRMVVENDAWRIGTLTKPNHAKFKVLHGDGWIKLYDTIEAAIDALMEELNA